MDTRPRTPTSIRVPIAWKFFAVLALVIPSLLAVYAHGVSVLGTIAGLGLLAGVGATLLLIRSVVVRTKEYSRFATRVAAGELNTRARPRGHDELTDLGWALNEMVARGEGARGYEATQGEFTGNRG